MRLALERIEDFVVVGEAGDGLEAIELVRAEQPDLILLDLAMPRMDGLEALPTLRALRPSATILVLSGFDSQSLAPMARAAGADGYLRKGASPQEIVERVRQLRGSETPLVRRSDLRLSPAALRSAPFGLLSVERDRTGCWWVTAANDTAEAMLDVDDATFPARLATVAEPLVDHIAEHRGMRRSSDEPHGRAMVGGRLLEVSLHGSGDELSVVLLPRVPSDDAARLRRAFAATAHEMRNPVTILIGAAEALAKGRDSLAPDVRDRLFDAIQRQARLLGRSTADMMAAAQQDHDDLTVDLETVVLRPVLEACTAAQPDAGTVDIDCPADLTVVADPGRVEQMIANLVSNAAKYGATPISIAARRDATVVHVDVCDSGAGVSEEFAPHLFEEFSREHGTAAHGSGLGLYVVRSLAQAQGGSVDYSRVDDRSVFSVTFPAGDARGGMR